MLRNSTIVPKKKQLSCGHFDYAFSKGRCKSCATIQDTKPIAKFSKKREAEVFGDGECFKPKGSAELQRWFERKHSEMKGYCKHCGGKTEKGKSTYKCSIAHILPKAYFPSVATHEDNWIELCFYGKSCHTNLDNHMIDLIELNCFDDVIKKFVSMYPSIAPQEKRRIPNILLQYLEVEK